jgi:L-ascorbate metabolism protein UlaG (beta-lactamase superfamily)
VRLIKYTHACVRIDDDDHGLVIDPGMFSEVESLVGADTLLITHEHPDHVNAEAIRDAARSNSALRIWAPAGVAASFADLGDRVTAVTPATTFSAGGFTIETFGGQHAMIHPLIPVVANVGYLINGAVYHPGDSFVVPPADVQTLLIPTHAPWSKVSEIIDFAIAVGAPQAIQIHDSMINENGRQIVEGHVTRLSAPFGTEFRHLAPLESVTV